MWRSTWRAAIQSMFVNALWNKIPLPTSHNSPYGHLCLSLTRRRIYIYQPELCANMCRTIIRLFARFTLHKSNNVFAPPNEPLRVNGAWRVHWVRVSVHRLCVYEIMKYVFRPGLCPIAGRTVCLATYANCEHVFASVHFDVSQNAGGFLQKAWNVFTVEHAPIFCGC